MHRIYVTFISPFDLILSYCQLVCRRIPEDSTEATLAAVAMIFLEFLQPTYQFSYLFLSCRRIPKDLTEATLAGGALSIVAAVAMIFLFGMELQAFLQTSATTTVIIDRSRDGDVMRINFNFSFPALSCEFASVDVSDVLGTVS